MTYLLDTNVCISAMRGNVNVRSQLLARAPTDCGISMVTLYELYSGVERSLQPALERRKIEALIRPMHALPFDESAASHAARIRWYLQQRGEIIGPYDLLLAGQALSLGVIFVTHNTQEFERVPGLMLEDWQAS